MESLRDRWVLVTGASSGLGADFARDFAKRGCKLVLVARREERLAQLAAELANDHGADTRVVALDLGGEGAADELHDLLRAEGIDVHVLVNNAGAGVFGPFLASEWPRQRQMLALDIVALTHLTHRFAKDMAARGDGYVLQVSSIGAFLPTPTYASYSAAKSFVLSFGEALARELKPHGVRVCTLCPGVTETEFFAAAGQPRSLFQRMSVVPSPAVVKIGVEALLRGRTSVVPGLLNKVSALSMRLFPRQWQAATAHALMVYGAKP